MSQPKNIDWLNGCKNKTHIYAVFKIPTSVLGTHTNWKWEDGRKYSIHTNRNQKKAGITILTSEKIYLKIKNIIQRRILWNDQMIIPRRRYKKMIIPRRRYKNCKYIIRSPQYIRQLRITLKWEIDNNPIIVGKFNTPLAVMDRSSRQKINK